MRPESIGSYRILGVIGEGGMGTVYLGEHGRLGRRAAIKVLLPALSARPDIVQRFFNEARAATTIADPGIVAVFDFGSDDTGNAYIVMELLDGESVDARLRRCGRLDPETAMRIARQVASTLSAAHRRGIVHRDLKPENVFLVPDPEVPSGERAKILDFGIAKLAGVDAGAKTQVGAIMGTPAYMSPEQCRGGADVDARSDIYALGCVLFHLVTGAPPFVGEGMGDTLVMQIHEPAPALSSRVPGISPALDAVVARCLAKSPADRFESMIELATALDDLRKASVPPIAASSGHYLAAAPGAPTTLSSATGAMATRPPARSRRLGRPLVAIAAAVMITVAIVVVRASGGSSSPPAVGKAAEPSSVPVDAGDAVTVRHDAEVVVAPPVTSTAPTMQTDPAREAAGSADSTATAPTATAPTAKDTPASPPAKPAPAKPRSRTPTRTPSAPADPCDSDVPGVRC